MLRADRAGRRDRTPFEAEILCVRGCTMSGGHRFCNDRSEAETEPPGSSHPPRFITKRPRFNTLVFLLSNVRERIRTPDTLVRSQVLYPAELHTHIYILNPVRAMPVTGIEPVLYHYNRILSPARLPVPPHGHLKWDLQGSNL